MSYDINTIKTKVDFEVEPFVWINPNLILGYNIQEVRESNFKLFLQGSTYTDEGDSVDEVIASYYLECDARSPNFDLLLDYALWLIENLFSSYVAYIYPSYIREYLSPQNVNKVFIILYEFFDKFCSSKEYHIAHLIKIFIFESMCYGPEWGSFLDEENGKIVSEKKIEIHSLKHNHYLCIYLLKDNLQKIKILQSFTGGEVPLYKY